MLKVLIVDDEEIICRGIKSILERIHNPDIGEIHMAFSGMEGEKAAASIRPDIMITDIRMPDISGLALIKNVLKSGQDVKFIVLSGYDEFEYVKEAFKMGVADYLLKPASVTKLREVLEKVIEEIKAEKEKKKSEKEKQNALMEIRIRENAVEAAREYIRENFRKNINMAIVANKVSMNYSYFSTLFKEKTGLNFVDYLTHVRMEEAKKLLLDPEIKIYEITALIGYDHPKHFTRVFKNHFGMSPKEYRKINTCICIDEED